MAAAERVRETVQRTVRVGRKMLWNLGWITAKLPSLAAVPRLCLAQSLSPYLPQDWGDGRRGEGEGMDVISQLDGDIEWGNPHPPPTRGVLVCSEPLLCVMEENGPAVLDQPNPPSVHVMESGPAMLDQPTPSLFCVMEESGPAVLDQPIPLLYLPPVQQLKKRQGKLHKGTSSCSLAALVVETLRSLYLSRYVPHTLCLM